MIYDAFEEGVANGGIRTKHEIQTLICYILVYVNKPLTRDIILEAILEKNLANYFDVVSCFEELVKDGNIVKTDENSKEYTYTENARIIANNLADTLPKTIKDRVIECTLNLIERSRIEKENSVKIEKTDNGYNVICTISGGDMDLLSFSLYVPEIQMARRIRKNFYKSPETIYEIMVAMLTKNKQNIENILESMKQVI